MTAKEFMYYIGHSPLIQECSDTFLMSVSRNRYAAYCRAYQITTYLESYFLFQDKPNKLALIKGLEDKDSGRPMARVPELETEGDK